LGVVSFAVLPLTVACEEEVVESVYRLVPVSERNISVSVSAAGSIEPVRTVEVKSKASGEIYQMRVETGDYVQQGNLLVQIDPRVPQATLRQAEADSVLACGPSDLSRTLAFRPKIPT
jgi:HlyD family secretion protein